MIFIMLGLLLLLIVVVFLPLTTVVNFTWDQEQRGLKVEFTPGIRMLKLQKQWNLQELESDEVSVIEETETASGKTIKKKESHLKTRNFHPRQFLWAWYWWNSKLAKRGFKRIRMHEIVWETSFSTGDVALTGVTTGVIWAVKGWVLGIASNRFALEKVQLDVWPRWDDRSLRTRFDCIVKTRLVHIIGIGISAAWYFTRYHLWAR